MPTGSGVSSSCREREKRSEDKIIGNCAGPWPVDALLALSSSPLSREHIASKGGSDNPWGPPFSFLKAASVMPTFGKAKGGGRRKARRSDAPLLVGLSTVTQDFRAAIVNVSQTGVRLSGPDLPSEREELMFRVDRVQAFGKVIWKRRNECGVAFDNPLSAAEVDRLRDAANLPSGIGLSPEEKAALEDWQLRSGD